MKVALVTGGAHGIGAEIVTKLSENYTVIINYNNSEQQARCLQQQLTEQGRDVHLYKCDVTDVKQIEQMFCWVEKLFKRVDVLVNNAGVALYKQVQDVTEEDFNKVFDVNCKGAFFCSKYAVKLMLARCEGVIVNVSSIWGLNGASCESVYSMSKYAVVGLTRSLYEELSDSGIRVNCICPPIVLTDMTAHLSSQDLENFEKTYNQPVLTPKQVANRIFDIITDDSIDGEIINNF